LPTKLLEEVLVEPRCQAREDLDAEVIAEYVELLEAGVNLGDIDVFDVSGALYVVDGFHRRASHLAAGKTFIGTRTVGWGSLEDAVWFATSANKAHGLRRTRADKRRAVELALATPIGSEQSNAVIAKHVGVSDTFVSNVRRETADQLATLGVEPPVSRIGADGKRRPVKRREEVAGSIPAGASTVAEVRASEGERGLAPSRPQSQEQPEEPPTFHADEAEALEAPPPRAPTTATPMPTFGIALEQYETVLRSLRLRARTGLSDELGTLKQRLEVGLKGLENALVAAIPEPCPACDGAGCAPCERRGWVPGSVAVEMRARRV
jgi:hypothetical protein